MGVPMVQKQRRRWTSLTPGAAMAALLGVAAGLGVLRMPPILSVDPILPAAIAGILATVIGWLLIDRLVFERAGMRMREDEFADEEDEGEVFRPDHPGDLVSPVAMRAADWPPPEAEVAPRPLSARVDIGDPPEIDAASGVHGGERFSQPADPLPPADSFPPWMPTPAARVSDAEPVSGAPTAPGPAVENGGETSGASGDPAAPLPVESEVASQRAYSFRAPVIKVAPPKPPPVEAAQPAAGTGPEPEPDAIPEPASVSRPVREPGFDKARLEELLDRLERALQKRRAMAAERAVAMGALASAASAPQEAIPEPPPRNVLVPEPLIAAPAYIASQPVTPTTVPVVALPLDPTVSIQASVALPPVAPDAPPNEASGDDLLDQPLHVTLELLRNKVKL